MIVALLISHRDSILNTLTEIAQGNSEVTIKWIVREITQRPLEALGAIASILTILYFFRDVIKSRLTKGAGKEGTIPCEHLRKYWINQIRNLLINNILSGSLSDTVPVEICLEECRDKIDPSRNLPFHLPNSVSRQLPTSTKILEIFDQLGGSFLISGEPGSGKTILLLQLAKKLLDRAESDETHPIPAVFYLSSWAARQQPLADWMVDELDIVYKIHRNLGEKWIKEDRILPLLDGLDEVAPDYREACVEAINKFRALRCFMWVS